MYSSKGLRRLWFFYQTEGEFKGVSINSFCMSNNVPFSITGIKNRRKPLLLKWSAYQLRQKKNNLVRQT